MGVDTSSALIDAKDLAAMLDASVRHVRRMDASGRLPTPVRLGRNVRWRRVDIDSWLASGCPLRKEFERGRRQGGTR